MKQLLYATGNPGKYKEVKKHLAQYGIDLKWPKDFDLDLDVKETGSSLEENSTLKAKTYIKALNDPNILVMADDTGVEIDALDGEPGIHVRRWKGHRMSDQEIIDYCIERMKGVPEGKRGAQFRTVIALGSKTQPIQTFEGILRGRIVKEPIPLKMEGFPFESVFYITEYDMMLGKLHQLPTKKKEVKELHSHRERAIENTLPTIQKLLNS